MVRAWLKTDAALARAFGISRQALAKHIPSGRLTRDPSGQWDAVDALEQWRFYASGAHDRGHASERPWLDANRELTDRLLARFLERCRRAGAVIVEDDDEDDQEDAAVDTAEVDRVLGLLATGAPLDEAAFGLVNTVAGGCGSFVPWVDLVAPRLAAELGYRDVERLRRVLGGAVRTWLRRLVTEGAGMGEDRP